MIELLKYLFEGGHWVGTGAAAILFGSWVKECIESWRGKP